MGSEVCHVNRRVPLMLFWNSSQLRITTPVLRRRDEGQTFVLGARSRLTLDCSLSERPRRQPAEALPSVPQGVSAAFAERQREVRGKKGTDLRIARSHAARSITPNCVTFIITPIPGGSRAGHSARSL